MWNAAKNDVFFQRVQNCAKALRDVMEERARLVDIYNNEAKPGGVDDPAFVDHAIATKQEVVDFATNVLNPYNTFLGGGAVTNLNRIPFLTPFLVEQ